MSRIIDNKIVDNKAVLRSLAKIVRKYVEEKDIKKENLAKILGVGPSRISQMLGSVPSNDEEMYRKILSACGYPASTFDKIKQEAINEHFKIEGEPDMDYALSSELGNNPDAIKEVKGFMQFVKNKYGVK